MFIDYDVFNYADTILPYLAPQSISGYTEVDLSNAVFDYIDISYDIDKDITSDNYWDQDTILHCDFLGNLNGGNYDSTLMTSGFTSISLQRRKSGNYSWDIIKTISVNTSNMNDLTIGAKDCTGVSEIEYEYALFCSIQGQDMKFGNSFVTSQFDGVVLADDTVSIKFIADNEISDIKRIQDIAKIKPLYNRFPFIQKNSKTDYYEGHFKSKLIDWDIIQQYLSNGHVTGITYQNYIDTVSDFLTNGKPKFFKNFKSKTLIVMISGDIGMTESSDLSENLIDADFDFSQIGDANSFADILKYDVGIMGDT